MVLNIGSAETVGEHIGENLAFSESRCIEIIMQLKPLAHGVQLNQSRIMCRYLITCKLIERQISFNLNYQIKNII